MDWTTPPPTTVQTDATASPQMREDLRNLKDEVEKLKSESNSKWKKSAAALGVFGGILGILSTMIAFPKSIKEAKDSWFVRPKTTIHVDDMAVSYQPGDATFTLNFPLLLSNDGNADDVIQSADGELIYSANADSQKIDPQHAEIFNAGVGEFTFYDKGSIDSVAATDKVPLPLQVGKNSGRPIFSSILFDKGTFTRAGLNRLNVSLISGTGKRETLSFCFFLDDQQISDLQQAQAVGRKRFLNPSCGDQ
jgi:hypothetical protein